MLIRTQKQVTEVQRACAPQQLLCTYCSTQVSCGPALYQKTRRGWHIYHMRCAMDLLYGMLADLSGYEADIQMQKRNKLPPTVEPDVAL